MRRNNYNSPGDIIILLIVKYVLLIDEANG